jgi:hypothetical protein
MGVTLLVGAGWGKGEVESLDLSVHGFFWVAAPGVEKVYNYMIFRILIVKGNRFYL